MIRYGGPRKLTQAPWAGIPVAGSRGFRIKRTPAESDSVDCSLCGTLDTCLQLFAPNVISKRRAVKSAYSRALLGTNEIVPIKVHDARPGGWRDTLSTTERQLSSRSLRQPQCERRGSGNEREASSSLTASSAMNLFFSANHSSIIKIAPMSPYPHGYL